MSDYDETKRRIDDGNHNNPDENSITAIEGRTLTCNEPYQKSKAEKKLVRKIDFMFLPLLLNIITVQARYNHNFISLHCHRRIQQRYTNRSTFFSSFLPSLA